MEKKSKKIFFIGMTLLLCLQIIVLFYYGSRKAGYHEDELYSYYSSNKTAGLFVNDREWTIGESFRNELVVLPGEQFRYGVVKQMQSWDVHPPFYYYLLHTVCSLTPGIFSKWQGISVNLLGFVLSFILLAYAAYLTAVYPISMQPELSDSEKQSYRKRGYVLAGTVCGMWGFGAAVISGVMFIRMYQWLTVFVLLCLCLHLHALVRKKESWSFYLLLAVTVFLGFLTQYYYIIFHFFLGAGFCLYLLKEKKWKSLMAYVGTCAAAFGAALVYYPSALSHIFRGYRGTEAVGEFANASNTLERLQFFIGLFDKYMMGGGLALWLLLICLIAMTNRFLQKRAKRSGREQKRERILTLPVGLLLFIAAGYFFTVAKTALLLGETSNRYELPIYGVLVLLLVYSLYMVQKEIEQGNAETAERIAALTASGNLSQEEIRKRYVPDKKITGKVAVLVVVLIAVLNLTGNKVFFLYPEEAKVQEFVHRNETTPVIVLYNEASETHIWWLLDELSEYENIYLASISGEGEILTSQNFLNGDAAESKKYIVYMADCENQGEELQRLLGTEFQEESDASGDISYEEIARKNMWTIYEIMDK
ncbi:MAG: hypothetical protein MR817_07370 [Lachnospiraceae bacterium]|nr:hypothetical protein [Lachnospiraceae bacterium]